MKEMKVNTDNGMIKLRGTPNSCPFCHKSITPNLIYGFQKPSNYAEVFMSCPNLDCNSTFIGYYHSNIAGREFYMFQQKTSKGTMNKKQISTTVNDISPRFSEIYNQAFFAEQHNLLEICGVGYRKALEFLIKDYSIKNHYDKKDKIQKSPLSFCINKYINDHRIKSVAKRAAWLGNDETHYLRKWEEKSLTDLKTLINLTLHWIEMEALSNSFETEMPE